MSVLMGDNLCDQRLVRADVYLGDVALIQSGANRRLSISDWVSTVLP